MSARIRSCLVHTRGAAASCRPAALAQQHTPLNKTHPKRDPPLPHLLELELLHTRLVRGDGGTLDADIVLLQVAAQPAAAAAVAAPATTGLARCMQPAQHPTQ